MHMIDQRSYCCYTNEKKKNIWTHEKKFNVKSVDGRLFCLS